MLIFNDTFVPYEFKNKESTFNYIIERAHYIKKSLKLIEMDNEHLTIKCPLSGDFLDIVGNTNELAWLNTKLSKNRWYRLN